MNNQNNIRNFAIIAHVDHGKSTLADRFLEITNTIPKEKMREQFLDQNPISRERGITIKLAPVRMNYTLNAINYTLNLIDTPGHVDFSYEVSRTLAACEGAILLIDATQGIQAQTVAHLNSAREEKLTIIPVINKIDLDIAKPEEVAVALIEKFGFTKDEIIYISAKTGKNVEDLLKAVIARIPAPQGLDSPLKALIFDAFYDEYKGVIVYVKIRDGKVKKTDRIKFLQSSAEGEVTEVGYFSPFLAAKNELTTGEIGYIITGVKDIRLARVGDTIAFANHQTLPLPGYRQSKPLVFFGVYPKASNELVHLKESLNALALNDTSLTIAEEHSAFLGSGFRVGFLGLLHAEIVKERLKKEKEIDAIFTTPSVLYKKEKETMFEPYIRLTVYSPNEYVGQIITVCQNKKGELVDMSYQGNNVIFTYNMPYSMLIRGLSSEIKTASSGFASIDYTLTDYRQADLVNLEIRVNDVSIDVLSEFVYRDEINIEARKKVEKLKNSLPKQQFRQIIQAVADSRILAKEEIAPFRKDVLAKMSGGDRGRKDKLLDKQKKGKKRLMSQAKITIPQEALLSLIGNS
ncbi:MAG: translation elongation factor 4 [Patescibacteria group bacterium]